MIRLNSTRFRLRARAAHRRLASALCSSVWALTLGCSPGADDTGGNSSNSNDATDPQEDESASSDPADDGSTGDHDPDSSGDASDDDDDTPGGSDPTSGDDDDDDGNDDDDDDDDGNTSTSSDDSDSTPDDSGQGLPLLGNNSHALDNVKIEVIGSADDGLLRPTDVEIHPIRGDEAWVTNQSDNAIVVFENVNGNGQAKKYNGQQSGHFLAKPSGLSFADNGFFATAHEEDQPTQGEETPWDYMGPTLWRSEPGMFDGDQPSHYDMLHSSPNSVGVTWEVDNVYWVFDGQNNALARYDFVQDHGPGGTDHRDGTLRRFAKGQLKYVKGIVSHMVYDAPTQQLYVADTGHSRIAVLDTQSGKQGGLIEPNLDCKDMPNQNYEWEDASLVTLIDGSGQNTYLPRPAGLEMRDDLLFVSDNELSYIYAFTKDGTLVDWLDMELPSGSLLGMSFDEKGRLYVIDGKANQLLRISPKSEL